MIGRTIWRRTLLSVALALPSVLGASSASDAVISMSLLTQAWTIRAAADEPRFQQDVYAISVHSLRLRGPLTLQGYLPVATTTDDQSGVSVSGAGDAQVRLSWHRPATRWRATLGIDLPTGQSALPEDEYRVAARMLASQVLDFQLKRLGEGPDLFGSISYGLPLGRNTMAGLALSGGLNSEYTLYRTVEGLEQRMHPGNRLRASASLLAQEHDQDPDWDLCVVLGGEVADQTELRFADRTSVVTEGIQGRLEATYAHRVGQDDRVSISALLSARDRNRSRDVELPVVEYLGIAVRSAARGEVSYTMVRQHWPRIALSVATAMFKIDPWEAIDSYVTLTGLEIEQPLRPWAALYAAARIGFGRTPWVASAADGQAEPDDCRLDGTSLGVGLRLTL